MGPDLNHLTPFTFVKMKRLPRPKFVNPIS